MSTDLALTDHHAPGIDSWAPMLPHVNMLAKGIADTEFVPKQLRGKEYAVAACVLTGREMGIGPMESLQRIYVVEGRPSLSAELMRSLVLRAGHSIEFSALTDKLVTIRGKRAASSTWTEITWTIADAQRIGVANKDVWRKYPRTMLANRATSELCRLIFPDALGGVTITPEEVEDESTATTTVTRASASESKPARVQRATAKAPEPVEPPLDDVDPETGEIVDAEVVEDTETAPAIPEVTRAQLTKMGAAFSAAGISDRAERLAYVSAVIGREVASSKELDRSEASVVIDRLEAERDTDADEPSFDEPTLDGDS